MRGEITKIFDDRYIVVCPELAEPVIILASDIMPPGLNKNLRDSVGNSNGSHWFLGGHIDFELVEGTCRVQRVGVCLQGR
jgi:hypothetical protein